MSLFSSLKPKANLSRNVFDRSRSETFSTKLGLLTPCFVEHTIPDGKYRINMSNICRVDSQVTANFAGLNQVVDFFYVPYSQLWHDFNKFYYGKGEETRMVTSLPKTNQPVYVPTFSLRSTIEQIFYACLNYYLYENFTHLTLSGGSIIPEYFLDWAIDQGIVLDGDGSSNSEFVDIHGRFCGYDMLRLLDMLGYGNYLPLLNYIMPNLTDNQIGSYASQSNVDSTSSDPGVSWPAKVLSLISPVISSVPDVKPNVFAILAYNKIFNDIYMNRIYPESTMEERYNVDYFDGMSASGSLSVIKCLKPWFRLYKKDMFTALYPDPQFGDVAIASIQGGSGYLTLPYRQGSFTLGTTTDAGQSSGSRVVRMDSSGNRFLDNFSLPSMSVSALAIRQTLAFQKYKETLLRAGNREEDLQRAMFGVGSKYIEDKYVDFLGSYQSAVQMNPVAATTEAANQNVGDLGAYAVGSIAMDNGKDIVFDAHDFGIIMGICYVMPDAKYEACGIDPHNVKFEADDYFNSKMQNLGLHPVYSHVALNVGIGGNTFTDSVLGYLAEYYEYKTAVSKVHGEFFGSNPAIPIKYDTVGGYDADIYTRQQEHAQGAFSSFVSVRDVRDVAGGTKQMLYIAPWDADRLFNAGEGVSQVFDHFKFEASFRVKAVLPMSVTGLPQ